MSEIQRVMKLLEDNSIQPKRAFGQNFLIDESIIEKIINSLDVEDYETVLEIGPGLGALTIPLKKRAKRMIAVEADRDMASILSKELKDSENFTLINEPFEHWNHDGLDTTNLLVVGNLPYNLTTKLLELTTQLGSKTLGFMLQKEVADKLKYTPNSPENSALSAYLALLGDAQIITYVPRGDFYPIPKVDSAFIKIDIKNNVDFKIYKELKKIYLNPNKTIHNNVKNGYSKEVLEAIEKALPDLVNKRARQLSVEETKIIGEKLADLDIL